MLLQERLITIISGLLFGFTLLAGTSCLAGSGPNLQEGLWEITSKMEMMGMNMPEMKHTQCMTKTDAVPESSPQDQQCRMVNTTVKGDTVTWNMVCDTPEGKSTMNGTITYHGDSFKGMLTINTQGMEMVQRMSGRRIGECR